MQSITEHLADDVGAKPCFIQLVAISSFKCTAVLSARAVFSFPLVFPVNRVTSDTEPPRAGRLACFPLFKSFVFMSPTYSKFQHSEHTRKSCKVLFLINLCILE